MVFVSGFAMASAFTAGPAIGHLIAHQVLADLRCFPVAVVQRFGEYPRSVDGDVIMSWHVFLDPVRESLRLNR